MNLFLRAHESARCWICRSQGASSKEHKFKASHIRRQFGADQMVVGRDGDSGFGFRTARGVDSRRLKFSSLICAECNSSTTQLSDFAYDKFMLEAGNIASQGDSLESVWTHPNFKRESELYLPLFRYFAKILGCHLADIRAPIPTRLAKFVAKRSSRNCVWVGIGEDSTFKSMEEIAADANDLKYVAHGGLTVKTRKSTLLPSQLFSTLSVGRIQTQFYYNLNFYEITEMQLRFPQFVEWCANEARRTLAASHKTAN